MTSAVRSKPRKIYKKDLSALRDEAEAWLTTLDRERISAFSHVDETNLFFLYVNWMARCYGSASLQKALSPSSGDPEYAVIWHAVRVSSVASAIEALFWMASDNSERVRQSVAQENRSRWAGGDLAVEKLNLVYDHQYAHDYFSAGIWDIEFIDRCIEEGIDPELAMTLLREM